MSYFLILIIYLDNLKDSCCNIFCINYNYYFDLQLVIFSSSILDSSSFLTYSFCIFFKCKCHNFKTDNYQLDLMNYYLQNIEIKFSCRKSGHSEKMLYSIRVLEEIPATSFYYLTSSNRIKI